MKISICMITYNHENYIREAIEGVLKQKVTFDIELVIGEDCSTDNTRKICQEYQSKYPEKIKLLLPEKNLGMIPNFITTLQACQGQYIALCEGDDYWTDEYKLQKQVAFLDANPEYVLCFHKVQLLEPDGRLVADYLTTVPEAPEAPEAVINYGNYIHTPSVIFRNIIKTYPEEIFYSPFGDFFMYSLLIKYGKVKYLDEIMAVYRNGVGGWSSLHSRLQVVRGVLGFTLIHRFFLKDNNPAYAACMAQRIDEVMQQIPYSPQQKELLVLLREPSVFDGKAFVVLFKAILYYEETAQKYNTQTQRYKDLDKEYNIILNSYSYRIGNKIVLFVKRVLKLFGISFS